MTKDLVCGYYGAHNRGDELILKVLTDYLKTRQAEVVVTSQDPAATAADYGVSAIKAHPSLRKGLGSFLREVSKADLFILGGGGLYQDYGKHFRVVLYYGMRVLIAGMLGKKVAYFALGFGNIELARSKRFIALVTRLVDCITVRDQGSREVLARIGVNQEIVVCADPVFSLATGVLPAPRGAEPEAGLRVGISILAYDGQLQFATGADQRIEQAVTSFTRTLLAQGHQVTFIPMERGTDDLFIGEILARAGLTGSVAVLNSSLKHDAFLAAFAGFDLVLAMRLHAIILSAALGIPFVPISYHTKVSNTVALLRQEDLMIPLEELSAERLEQSFKLLVQDYQRRQDTVIEECAALNRETARLFSSLDRLLPAAAEAP